MSALPFVEDDPILIEVDSRIIRDLVALTAMALQIATGSHAGCINGFDAQTYQTAQTSVLSLSEASTQEVAI